jgi:hypothetical protein
MIVYDVVVEDEVAGWNGRVTQFYNIISLYKHDRCHVLSIVAMHSIDYPFLLST